MVILLKDGEGYSFLFFLGRVDIYAISRLYSRSALVADVGPRRHVVTNLGPIRGPCSSVIAIRADYLSSVSTRPALAVPKLHNFFPAKGEWRCSLFGCLVFPNLQHTTLKAFLALLPLSHFATESVLCIARESTILTMARRRKGSLRDDKT